MDFQIGDTVVHCAHGLGQVLAIEERAFDDDAILYYMVQVADLTVWVPADENLRSRLRLPTSEASFRKSLSILATPAEQLPEDRRQRNLQLQEMLKDGSIESLCKVIRDLAAYRHARSWSEYDTALMKRAEKALIGEWIFILSVTPAQAEMELHRLLSHKAG
jgi:RNA polymerase-interacting CarD/CdnL/TRCF family regulator